MGKETKAVPYVHVKLFEATTFGAPIWAKFTRTLSFLTTPIANPPRCPSKGH